MFSNAFKTLLSKPAMATSVFKASKTPFQAALLQRSFARNFQKTSGPTYNETHTENIISPAQSTAAPVTGPTVDSVIREDVSLNKFMTKIYSTTGLSIASCLSLSGMIAASAAIASPGLAVFGGVAMSIGGIIAMGRIQPQITVEKGVKGKLTEVWKNPMSRKLAFSSLIVGSAISLSPLMQLLLAINPGVIPMAAGLSLFTMGGASLYSMYKPLGHFKAWESTMYSALLGLVAMNLASIATFAVIGPNVFSLACGRVDLYLGLGLFTAFQAIDTHTAVQSFKEGNLDHLQHVVNFFLNFKNLFVRIASILAQLRE